MDWIGFRDNVTDNRMARLVIGHNLFLIFTDDATLSFGASDYAFD